MRRLAICVALLLSCIGCGRHNQPTPDQAETVHTEYKTIWNARFDFLTDIPADWAAEDRSENGDGCFLLPGNSAVDLRVYAGFVMPENDYYTEMSRDPAYHPQPFRFHGGHKGVGLTKGDARYFIRTEKNVHIVLYAKANRQWMERHEPLLKKVAASLRLAGEQEYRIIQRPAGGDAENRAAHP